MFGNNLYSAQLKIKFCIFHQVMLYTFISIDNEMYTTEKDIDVQLQFDQLETELGKKVCFIELFYFEDGKKISTSSYIEIYPGYNQAYCFLDVVGTTYEFIFYRKNIKYFLANNFEIFSKEYNKKISVNLNSMNLNDRANLILINCLKETNFLINNTTEIDLANFCSSIPNFYYNNSYLLFFNNNDFDKVISKEIKPVVKLNFPEIYNKNKHNVENMFNGIMCLSNTDENIFKTNFELISKCNKYLVDIIYNNFVLPKSILIQELNQTEYIDFIYKIVFYSYLNRELDEKKNITFSEIKDLMDKLNKAYNKISNDNSIEIYEKILIFINIYHSKYFKHNNKIKYFNINNAEKDSPLICSKEFLCEFIEGLDYESNFYYPLLLIDGGLFNYKYKYDFWFRTFGANMNTIEDIKNHLRNLIPNIVIYSKEFKNESIDDYGYVMPQVGIITINKNYFGKNCDKKEPNEKIRKHQAFILSRIFLHGIFRHKKRSFSKDSTGKILLSANCFKDEANGKFRFLPDGNNDDIYKDITEIDITEIDKSTGDSGYFLEFYFGKIGDEYTIDILDELENKINFGILLDTKIWHKEMNKLKEYIRLKKYIYDKNMKIAINDDNNIDDQINEMKTLIFKEEKISEEKDLINVEKVKYNYFDENKFELLDEINKKEKKKKSSKHEGMNDVNKNVQISKLFEEAFNPFNLDKILQLEKLYPKAFFKK